MTHAATLDWRLTSSRDEPSFAPPQVQDARAALIRDGFDAAAVAEARRRLDAFVAGREPLSAIEFYAVVEAATPLLLFHTLPRSGDRNRLHCGLQQSYGDHTRILLLGFDAFDQRDLPWLLTRRWGKPTDATPAMLAACIDAYHALGFTPADKAVAWVAASLHDYGKLHRRGFGLDAEDAEPLARPLLERLCDPALLEPIVFAIRNHDLIEHVVTGATSAAFIADQLDALPAPMRPKAVGMLAMIQLVGAASLGEGRITARKIEIFNACLDRSIIGDATAQARLGRMLEGEQVVADEGATRRAAAVLAAQPESRRTPIVAMLDKALLHDWAAQRDEVLGDEDYDQARHAPIIMDILDRAATAWDHAGRPLHVVFEEPAALADPAAKAWASGSAVITLLNGSRALLLR